MKEFMSRFFMMLLYAWGAGSFSALLTFLFFVKHYSDFNFATAFTMSMVFGTFGLLVASPILIFFALWFWYIRNKKALWVWLIAPTVLSILEVGIGTLVFQHYEPEDILRFIFIFAFTGFQTAFYMWLKYSKFKSADISDETILTVENANANH